VFRTTESTHVEMLIEPEKFAFTNMYLQDFTIRFCSNSSIRNSPFN
jgi:hypothetical protein